MTISIWRYSHLILAISSFLFLTLAAVTGVILAFDPLIEKTQPYAAVNFNQLNLAETLPLLHKKYPGISSLTIDANQFVKISGSDTAGEKLLAYVHPETGEILGKPAEKSEFFQWVTALHRSLFLHETGRFFIGLTAFLLLLITVSGTMLLIQRQRGLKRFFNKIAKDNFAQYYHVVLSRWSMVPIFIIALSGTYLSLVRFGLIKTEKKTTQIDFDAIRSAPVKNTIDFDVFKQIKLSVVDEVEFPFSEDAEDYYTLKLKDRELAVNQITGDILAEVKYPKAIAITNLSLDLHTGRANSLWAIVLAVASANVLFFIYSGFVIAWKRRANRTKNKYPASESRFIILVGSENGSTFRFAQAVHQQLIKAGERSFLTELNHYTTFPKAEHLIVFTATYGLGDAPTNAAKFAGLLEKQEQPLSVHYSVIGFGSNAYPDFCQFAFEVNHLLSQQNWAKPLTDIHTVDDKSPADFALWAEAWSQQSGITLSVLPELNSAKAIALDKLTVQANTPAPGTNGVFKINFKQKRRLNVKSGDLLAIYPENDHRERLYSIGLINKEIQLSVRLHEGGLGSGFLKRLEAGAQIQARIVKNEHFHFPAQAAEVIMISNGTGIAPFLGMIDENLKRISCHLYCGFRDRLSYEMYHEFLGEKLDSKNLTKLHTAFSRDGEKQYVSDLIAADKASIAAVLNRGGVIMICGSLAMQKDVIELLDTICQAQMGVSVSFYQSHHQIRTDCY